MQQQIKAIETVYKGYRFRSRLEARWAVFFDTLSIPWEYEKEGFSLPPVGPRVYVDDDGKEVEKLGRVWISGDRERGPLSYLPDFWLPKQRCWIEIKPDKPDEDGPEWTKMSRLAWSTHHPVFVFYGQIPMPMDEWNGDGEGAIYISEDGVDYSYWWCECPACGGFGVEFDGRSDRLDCKECYWCALIRCGHKSYGSPGDPWFKDLTRGCPVHGTTLSDGCERTGGNHDKGYNLGSSRLMAAYKAARSARFEHGENGTSR